MPSHYWHLTVTVFPLPSAVKGTAAQPCSRECGRLQLGGTTGPEKLNQQYVPFSFRLVGSPRGGTLIKHNVMPYCGDM